MHHPDIHDIISILKDYFLLPKYEFRCQIEPTIYSELYINSEPIKLQQNIKGLKIIHQLKQGRIEVNIFGIHEDYDSMDVQYFGAENLEKPLEIISHNEYHNQLARDAIRKVMILDRDRDIKSKS